MHAYLSNLARFCVSEFDVAYKDTIYGKHDRLALLREHPEVSAYLTTVINTRHLIMFDEGVVNAELIQGPKGPELNMRPDIQISACALGPIALEAWEVDLLMNATPINDHTLDISEPIQIFKDFIAEQPTLVPMDVLVPAYYASEVHQAALTLEIGNKGNAEAASFSLGTAMLDIIISRNNAINTPSTDLTNTTAAEPSYGPE